MNKVYQFCFAFVFLLFINGSIKAQVVYENISNEAIYDYLDELANQKIIQLNDAIKPYSRQFIAQQLQIAQNYKDQLSKRQIKELDFYLKDYFLELNQPFSKKGDLLKNSNNFAITYNPIAFQYKDSLFRFRFKPIFGGELFLNNGNENNKMFHRWWGGEIFGYVTKHIGVYFNLRDNQETQAFINRNYFNQRQGSAYKTYQTNGIDYAKGNGGVTYAWKWGEFGFIKDDFEWGSNYNGSNIFSGHQPSIAHLSLRVKPAKWLEYNWIFGWLTSSVIDSTNSYYQEDGLYRSVERSKWLATNMLTITPIKHLNISIGNSVIVGDKLNAAYLAPVMFYRVIDNEYNEFTNVAGESGNNIQMFMDISTRNLKYTHFYMTLFCDEFQMERTKTSELHNFFSWKFGGRLSNFPLKNLAATLEYTRTLPGTFQHCTETTTFASNNYNMGHYLRSNSDEIYAGLRYKPIRGLMLDLSYTYARHGNDIEYTRKVDADYVNITKVKPLDQIVWDSKIFGFTTRYEILLNTYIWITASYSDIQGYDTDDKYSGKFITAQEYLDKFTPKFYQGKKMNVSGGMTIGF